MERRRLGGTDLELSVIGLGTWVFGGRWGGAEDADSEAACHAALDSGINWIDTADIYGQGRAERIVGRVVRDRGDDVVVATKGGVAWEVGEGGLRIWREASAAYLRMSLERSLTALGLDAVDLYQVHWPVGGVPAEETIGALVDLRAEGKIRAIGVSNYHLPDLEAAGAVAALDSFQPGYHLMRRDIEDGELAWCAANGVGVIAYGPLGHGLLTGKMGSATRFAAPGTAARVPIGIRPSLRKERARAQCRRTPIRGERGRVRKNPHPARRSADTTKPGAMAPGFAARAASGRDGRVGSQ